MDMTNGGIAGSKIDAPTRSTHSVMLEGTQKSEMACDRSVHLHGNMPCELLTVPVFHVATTRPPAAETADHALSGLRKAVGQFASLRRSIHSRCIRHNNGTPAIDARNRRTKRGTSCSSIGASQPPRVWRPPAFLAAVIVPDHQSGQTSPRLLKAILGDTFNGVHFFTALGFEATVQSCCAVPHTSSVERHTRASCCCAPSIACKSSYEVLRCIVLSDPCLPGAWHGAQQHGRKYNTARQLASRLHVWLQAIPYREALLHTTYFYIRFPPQHWHICHAVPGP